MVLEKESLFMSEKNGDKQSNVHLGSYEVSHVKHLFKMGRCDPSQLHFAISFATKFDVTHGTK